MIILFFVYMAAGYWAVGKTIWKDKIIIYTRWNDMFIKRMFLGTLLGWLLIPWAIIKR